MADDLVDRVRRVIAKTIHIPLESVAEDSTFEGLGMDSLDRANLLFDLEEEFDINIPDQEAQGITSVREVVAGIEKLVSLKATDVNVASRQ
jgi:acyl carrier protein